jgi:hypothetical protein
MPEKLERCVKHLIAKGKAKDSAWPICVSSTGLKPHKGKKKKMKESVQEGETTGGSGVGTGKRIATQLNMYKNLSAEKAGKKKSQVYNIMNKMRNRKTQGSEFNAGAYYGTVAPAMKNFDKSVSVTKKKKVKESIEEGSLGAKRMLRIRKVGAKLLDKHGFSKGTESKLDKVSTDYISHKKNLRAKRNYKSVTKEQATKIVTQFLESKGIEANQENINEFLGGLAGLIGRGVRKLSFHGHKAANKLTNYSAKKSAEHEKHKSIKSANKVTHGANSGLKKLTKQGPQALRSREGRKLQLINRQASASRLAARGIKLKNNKGRFPKSKDFAHIKRQVERFIEAEKSLIKEGSIGVKRNKRIAHRVTKAISPPGETFINRDKLKSTLATSIQYQKKLKLKRKHRFGSLHIGNDE